jgi:glutamate synthase (NADPH/NADH) large chain/glutamate synthase (ferredoxin)
MKKSNLLNLAPVDSCGVGFVASKRNQAAREILDFGLTSLANVAHRGAIAADGQTGDGAGITTSIPRALLRRWLGEQGIAVDLSRPVGIGTLFIPTTMEGRRFSGSKIEFVLESAKQVTKQQAGLMGLRVLGFRKVPVNFDCLGEKSRQACPALLQVFVDCPHEDEERFERELFLMRRSLELTPKQVELSGLYVASLSCRTISYKGMVLANRLKDFYPDLQSSEYECQICLFHQRFSTNTSPSWNLCQPFRMLAHNGEINTIRGNRNWMSARESSFNHSHWRRHRNHVRRLFSFDDSDSSSLDNAVEILHRSGRSLMHALAMLIPPAWENDPRISEEQKSFFQYYQCFSEPWDGPAAVAITDGITVGACLDRNGLRPARYKVTKDDIVIVSSEVGADRIDDRRVVSKGRLGPGQMIAVDTVGGRLLLDNDIKDELAAAQPYGQWLADESLQFDPRQPEDTGSSNDGMFAEPFLTDALLLRHQIAAGVTSEELDPGLTKMASDGVEPTFSMGVDTPLAVLSRQPRLLSDYFKQRFAQVTNPPIDPIRERLVMSISAGIGPERNILDESPQHCRVFSVENPVLLPEEHSKLLSQLPFEHHSIDCTWDAISKENDQASALLQKSLEQVIDQTRLAIDRGVTAIILSDKNVSPDRAALPMLLVVGAVHHALCVSGQRLMCSLVVETSEVRDPHQLALMFGYGATVVYPYLAYQSLARLQLQGKLELEHKVLFANYRSAMSKGILKIMSKMGISVLNSYQGAQIFEAVGIGADVIDRCFKYSYSSIGGVGFTNIAHDTLLRHEMGFAPEEAEIKLPDPGIMKPKRSGELHVISGRVTKSFHQFVRENRGDDFEAFKNYVESKQPVAIRDLLQLNPGSNAPVELTNVEPIEEIRQRFTTAAMSLGAISPEAHEAIAIAMNKIGGKSNSGEGGESPERFSPRPDGTSSNSKIKQVASGRFGVNAEYLANAEEIEIKMAQGAKPGEGGQLPGFKVHGLIPKLRNTEPGVTLISPPPHHDIYSIEDLSQLIYDMKVLNPRARVCVKLVAKSGVGGIAVGVAKAKADSILISGHEGGTGASPLTSIKHAGIPWELGLAEAHQSLVAAELRNKVVLRVDGGLRTARDIIHAAILGAEEFNFGTMALIALGCVYVKKCHLNNCPVGIATQDPKYREKFKGKPENLINYLNAVAEDCRNILAELGCNTIDQIVGRTELLSQISDPVNPKTARLDLSCLLSVVDDQFQSRSTREKYQADRENEAAFDDQFLELALGNKETVFDFEVNNTDRNIGTRLSGAIASEYGKAGWDQVVSLSLTGSAGQSFGAFLNAGVELKLVGEANDYVGKGMSGGKIVIRPPEKPGFDSWENVIAGNTILYGATGGVLYASGLVSERFCVRNSGALAVVEGCGDHGCEYMTRGTAVILGPIGNNFGAGMTGGVAFIYAADGPVSDLINDQTVNVRTLTDDEFSKLKDILVDFQNQTNSRVAEKILNDWDRESKKFIGCHPQ